MWDVSLALDNSDTQCSLLDSFSILTSMYIDMHNVIFGPPEDKDP